MLMSAQMQAQNEITVYDTNTGENEVIELPEGMTENIDSLLSNWHSQKFLQVSGDCQMKDENREYTPETYTERLSMIPNVIEMPYNDVVRKFIDIYTGRLRRSVSAMLGSSNFYMPIFEEALDAYGLPLELKYLPIIESGLNPKATSRVGAAGLWQFMITTGKRYGLETTSLIDERRDPIKASYAAAHYLKDLYNIYQDWTLVIAAYNCGPGTVNKAIHRANGEKDYWKIYNYLPNETRGYVPSFIAANYVMNFYCEHNICPMEAKLPSETDTVIIKKQLHFQQIADICNVSMDEIKALNPQYRTNVIPGNQKPCILRLSHNAINSFIDAGDSIYAYKADELFTKRNIVEVSNDISSWQNSQPKRGRYVRRHGRRVWVPYKNQNAAAAPANKRKRRGGNGGNTAYHNISGGETLSSIAKKYHTSVKHLQKINGIKGTNIRSGEKIKVK